MTTTANTGPAPGDGPRAMILDALASMVAWLRAHPDIPVPNDVMLTYRTEETDQPDQAVRFRDMELLAELLGCKEYGSKYGLQPARQFDYTVAAKLLHGVEITYRGVTGGNEQEGTPQDSASAEATRAASL